MENISGGAMGNEIDLCDPETYYEDAVFSNDDLVLIAIPSYGGHVPKTALDRIAQIDGAGVMAVLVCVYGKELSQKTEDYVPWIIFAVS